MTEWLSCSVPIHRVFKMLSPGSSGLLLRTLSSTGWLQKLNAAAGRQDSETSESGLTTQAIRHALLRLNRAELELVARDALVTLAYLVDEDTTGTDDSVSSDDDTQEEDDDDSFFQLPSNFEQTPDTKPYDNYGRNVRARLSQSEWR